MTGSPPPRKQVDLTTWPPAARWAAVAVTIAVVVGLALVFGDPGDGATVPVSAIVAALIAFAVVAWRRQHR
ncbi:MAG: hypothetical protein J7513_11485 [Solirubrobacteraceae bacterium]|nr:hypothetical protein [Solirubrobacteraceae bacterium]